MVPSSQSSWLHGDVHKPFLSPQPSAHVSFPAPNLSPCTTSGSETPMHEDGALSTKHAVEGCSWILPSGSVQDLQQNSPTAGTWQQQKVCGSMSCSPWPHKPNDIWVPRLFCK